MYPLRRLVLAQIDIKKLGRDVDACPGRQGNEREPCEALAMDGKCLKGSYDQGRQEPDGPLGLPGRTRRGQPSAFQQGQERREPPRPDADLPDHQPAPAAMPRQIVDRSYARLLGGGGERLPPGAGPRPSRGQVPGTQGEPAAQLGGDREPSDFDPAHDRHPKLAEAMERNCYRSAQAVPLATP